MEEIKEKFSKEKFVPIKNITPLNSPQEFKKTLFKNIKESTKAYILCLYMGTGNEVKEVLELLKERKKKGRSTKIMLDYNRSKRTPELDGLLSEYGLTDDVTFFAPGYELLFPLDLGLKHKMIELFSVLHSKLFIFDDQVILTGANLEDSYLTNRTDRYLLIEGKEFIVYATKIFYKYFTNSSTFDTKKINIQNEMTVSFFYNEKREKEIFKKIFDIEFEEIYISTGYLNFPKEYLSCLKGKKVKIIIPSPKTSTYTQLKVFQNNIVESYSVIARDTKRTMCDAIIYEYNGPNSFHSKGVWLFKKDIAVTLCGSSNFNRRSTERDYESNFFILTKEKETIFKLKKEIKDLESRSKVRDLKDLENRNISLFTRIIEYFINKFL